MPAGSPPDEGPIDAFVRLGGSFLAAVFGFPKEEPLELNVGLDTNGWAIYFLSALTCFLVQWVVRLVVLNPMASFVLPRRKNGEPSKNVVKFAQAATEFYVYSFFVLAGIRVWYAQPWIWPSKLWWEGKLEGEHWMISPPLKFMYLLYAGRYLAQLVTVFIEPKRKDFWEMVIHHSATTILVSLSYNYGFVRVGAAVMLLLDPADPPLHAAKLCKYLAAGDISSRWQW